MATLIAPLGIFIDPVVEAATSGDDFYLDEVRKKRMTVYIGIVPTETAVFSRLTNLFFSQLITVNVEQGLPSNNPDAVEIPMLPVDGRIYRFGRNSRHSALVFLILPVMG